MAREAQAPANDSELNQLRAEVALLRAQQERYEAYARETEGEKRKHAEFLTWVALTAEEKTQLVADKLFAGDQRVAWEVQLQEHPKVRLPAGSKYEAIGRYKEICGIISTEHEIMATCLGADPGAGTAAGGGAA